MACPLVHRSRHKRAIPQPWNSIVLSVEIRAAGFLGALLFAAYMALASRICCGHTNEVFSSQAIEDYKNFLRLHIGKDGTLTVHAFGIDKTPRRWRLNKEAPAGHPWFVAEAGVPDIRAQWIDKFQIRRKLTG